MTIENVFGFLKGTFRSLKHLDADIERIPKIIKARFIVHNISLNPVNLTSLKANEWWTIQLNT